MYSHASLPRLNQTQIQRVHRNKIINSGPTHYHTRDQTHRENTSSHASRPSAPRSPPPKHKAHSRPTRAAPPPPTPWRGPGRAALSCEATTTVWTTGMRGAGFGEGSPAIHPAHVGSGIFGGRPSKARRETKDRQANTCLLCHGHG